MDACDIATIGSGLSGLAMAIRSSEEEIDERMQGTVWNTGCASWYLDATGRNSMLWPDWTWRFRQRTANFDPRTSTSPNHARQR